MIFTYLIGWYTKLSVDEVLLNSQRIKIVSDGTDCYGKLPVHTHINAVHIGPGPTKIKCVQLREDII
jgi:hypothetical protein